MTLKRSPRQWCTVCAHHHTIIIRRALKIYVTNLFSEIVSFCPIFFSFYVGFLFNFFFALYDFFSICWSIVIFQCPVEKKRTKEKHNTAHLLLDFQNICFTNCYYLSMPVIFLSNNCFTFIFWTVFSPVVSFVLWLGRKRFKKWCGCSIPFLCIKYYIEKGNLLIYVYLKTFFSSYSFLFYSPFAFFVFFHSTPHLSPKCRAKWQYWGLLPLDSC